MPLSLLFPYIFYVASDKIVKDDNNEPVLIQKMVAQVCPRLVHLEMLKSPDEGGFYGARDSDGNVLISETAMRRHWPNWIVRMTKRFKAMCVCDKCGVPTEVSESRNIKRMKIIKKLKSDINRMRSGRKKMAFIAHVKEYGDEIMDGGKLAMDDLISLALHLALTLESAYDKKESILYHD